MSKTVYTHRKVLTNALTGETKDLRARSEVELELKIKNQLKKWSLVGPDTEVREWADTWKKKYVYPKVNLKTAKDVDYRLDNFILPVIGSMPLCKVMPMHCQNVLDSLSGYSLDRINKVFNTMFQMFNQAQANWMIERNPSVGLIKPHAENKGGRPLTREERHYFLKVCKTHQYGDWALIMFYCGLRPGETAIAKWKHLKDGGIFVDGTKTKNAKRTVPMPDDLYQRLNAKRGKPEEYIFTRTANHLYPSGLTRNWQGIKKAMEIAAGTKVYRNELMEPHVFPDDLIGYCCRHTFATELKDAQLPFTIMQELLGHSTGTITDTYLHSTDNSFKVAKRILTKHRKKRYPYHRKGANPNKKQWEKGKIQKIVFGNMSVFR